MPHINVEQTMDPAGGQESDGPSRPSLFHGPAPPVDLKAGMLVVGLAISAAN